MGTLYAEKRRVLQKGIGLNHPHRVRKLQFASRLSGVYFTLSTKGRIHLLNLRRPLLDRAAISLVFLALSSAVLLLAQDAGSSPFQAVPRNPLSAAPLLLIGSAFLIIQITSPATRHTLLKDVLLAASFWLWGIVQLIPSRNLSLRLGSVVITLFVLDLAWAVVLKVRTEGKARVPQRVTSLQRDCNCCKVTS